MRFRRKRRDGLPAVDTFRDPGPRGYEGAGGGRWLGMANPTFLRGTSDMVAWLFPWILGSGASRSGVPLGKISRKVAGRRSQGKGAALCADPYSWYKSKKISVPSAFVIGLPGLGKSTLLRRWVLGLDYFGVTSLILGDLKGEYVDLVRDLDGQVIRVGRGAGYINVLDMGSAPAAVAQLRAAGFPAEADQLMSVSRGRRQAAVETLLTLQCNKELEGKEIALLAAALRELDRVVTDRVPILDDLRRVMDDPTPDLDRAARSHGDRSRYYEVADDLLVGLQSLADGNGLGEVFGQETTVQVRVDKHAVFDVSGLDDTDQALIAASLMICWSVGFHEIAVANTLAAAKLGPQRIYHVILDELWRALRAAPGLPARVDGLTRLNRDKGVATSYASHTMDDLAALQNEADRRMAAGILERCGMVVAFGCAASEMPRLQAAVKLTRVEQETLTSWTTPPTLSGDAEANGDSEANEEWPGRGMCLIKVGTHPGIPVEIELVPIERQYSNTAKKWESGEESTELVAA